MSRTDIAELNPPKKAAGETVASKVPICTPSFICLALPSCAEGKSLNSTSPFVLFFTKSATISSV
jgi:hypothetical protein